jgi:hypothetical protein
MRNYRQFFKRHGLILAGIIVPALALWCVSRFAYGYSFTFYATVNSGCQYMLSNDSDATGCNHWFSGDVFCTQNFAPGPCPDKATVTITGTSCTLTGKKTTSQSVADCGSSHGGA